MEEKQYLGGTRDCVGWHKSIRPTKNRAKWSVNASARVLLSFAPYCSSLVRRGKLVPLPICRLCQRLTGKLSIAQQSVPPPFRLRMAAPLTRRKQKWLRDRLALLPNKNKTHPTTRGKLAPQERLKHFISLQLHAPSVPQGARTSEVVHGVVLKKRSPGDLDSAGVLRLNGAWGNRDAPGDSKRRVRGRMLLVDCTAFRTTSCSFFPPITLWIRSRHEKAKNRSGSG